MDPEQRTEREITYQVGWKRGKIKLNPGRPAAGEEPPEKADSASVGMSGASGWNIRYLWRSAGTMPEWLLQAVLWVFPVMVFGISLWLVYQLSLQP